MVGSKEIKIQGRILRIARVDGDKYMDLENPEALCDGLRASAERIDIFTFMQLLPETLPKHDYPMEMDNYAALPVSTFDNWWTKQVDAKTRNMARKGEKKGLVVKVVPFDAALIRGISEIYNESPIRQGRKFPHYRKSLEAIAREEGTFPETSIFIGAFLEESLVGFVKLVYDPQRRQAGLMNILSMVKQRDKAPTNALIAHAVRICAEQGIPYLVYANFAYGKKETDSLADFKRNNGFQKIEVPRYYVPLTPLGELALRLKLHHKLSDRLPESFRSKLRDWRTAWYARKFQSSAEAT